MCISSLIIFIILGTVSAKDYYVATSGSNANSGTLDHPWRDIEYGVNHINPGDTVWIRSGTYVIRDYIKFDKSGTFDKPMNLRKYDGTVTIDGLDSTVDGIHMRDRSYWNIDGIDITNTKVPIYWKHQDSHHVTLSDSEISNFINSVSMSDGAHDITLDNVRIHTLASGSHNHVNILGNYEDSPSKVTKNIIIKNCEIYDNNKHGGINFGPSSKSGVHWYDKYVIDGVTIENTKIHDIAQGSICCNYVTVNNLRFINNTIYDSYCGPRLTLKDSVLSENEIYGIGPGQTMALQFENGRSRNVTFEGNYIHDNPSVRGDYAIRCRNVDGVIVSNLKQEEMAGAVVFFEGSPSDTIVKDMYEDKYIVKFTSESNGATFEYTNGDVFELTGSGNIDGPVYESSKSIATVTTSSTTVITGKHYNMTVQPQYTITKLNVNTFNPSTDTYNWSAESSKKKNPTWFNINVNSAFSRYIIHRDGSYYTTITSDSNSIARLYYAEHGNEWETPHNFNMEYSHNQSSNIYHPILNINDNIQYNVPFLDGKLQNYYIDRGHINDPDQDAVEWYNKGLDLFYLGKYEDALYHYDMATKLIPQFPIGWNNKGNTLSYLGRYNEAIECYDNALELDSESAEVWNNKGLAYVNLENYNEALICYQNALEIDSQLAVVWNNKGNALYKLGWVDEANRSFEKAHDINPTFNNNHIPTQISTPDSENEISGFNLGYGITGLLILVYFLQRKSP